MIYEKEYHPYQVGALMYVSALKQGVGEKIVSGAFSDLHSLAFCLEDAVADCGVGRAEATLARTLEFLSRSGQPCRMPALFVRVRGTEQLRRLPSIFGGSLAVLKGLIFPKFDLSNAAEYCAAADMINEKLPVPLYFMPTLESGAVIRLDSRKRTLTGLRGLLDKCRELVLNVRVGAMDICKPYGLRRAVNQTVYDIAIVREVLSDILTVFSDDYVVSAPVWEYFSDASDDRDWETGMERELQLDMLNGFIGKTIIHPSQVALVNKWLKPTSTDVSDAKAILDWKAGDSGISRSTRGNRMNELATHEKWARKTLILSHIYGERD